MGLPPRGKETLEPSKIDRAPTGAARHSAWAAVLVGGIVWFVAAFDLLRFFRTDLFTDADPAWAVWRLLLTLSVIALSIWAGGVAAAVFFLWTRSAGSTRPLEPLALSRLALSFLAAGALAFGVLVRFAWLAHLPPVVWIDEVLPIPASLALKGNVSDLADFIRILPTDFGSQAFSGVLYLEALRPVLHLLGTDLAGVRFGAAFAGALSLVTAMWLARALLPRGGATLAGLALAGLRWQLILARFAWNALALAPIVDVAILLVLRARRRIGFGAAAAGGVVAGLGAHVYLAAWIAGLALAGVLLWPQSSPQARVRTRLALAFVFGLGFLASASPIFLFQKGRAVSYFARGSVQTMFHDIRRTKSKLVPFTILADSFQAPWLVPDPVRRQDLPKSRLGWILGLPVAMAFLRALRSPREDLSAVLFAHCGAAVLASLRWGLPGHPNGFRFVYLTTITAVAAAAGLLWLVGAAPVRRRRAAAIAAIGLVAIASLSGARDALMIWAPSRETFDAYWGESTLIGRSALRWENHGNVALDPQLRYSPTVVGAVRRYRLDPGDRRLANPSPQRLARRCFQITTPGTAPRPGQRRVETVQDPWDRTYAVVLGGPCRGDLRAEAVNAPPGASSRR
jgi:hypothetical protein